MNKKILSALLVASLTITGLFAYTAPSNVVLTAKMTSVDYQFKLQQLNDSLTSWTDYNDVDYSEDVTLDATGGETNVFTVATKADGNMKSTIEFSTEITTGEFLSTDSTAEVQSTGWFPVIEDYSGTVENTRNEEVVYDSSNSVNGNYSSSSTGYFKTSFNPGKHDLGTEIARFSLKYKGDDEIVAGSYSSTTIIEITT